MKIMVFRLFLTCLFMMAIVMVSGLSITYAQTQSQSQAQAQQAGQAVNYQSTLISEGAESVDLTRNTYFVREYAEPFTLPIIENVVRSKGQGIELNHTSHINLGLNGRGTWFVMPITNASADDVWDLDVGSILDGRISTLHSFLVFNMNTREMIVDNLSESGKEKNIPPTITLKIPSKQTIFLIVYAKPHAGIPTHITFRLEKPNAPLRGDIILGWITIITAIGATFFFLKSFQVTKSPSKLIFAVLWGVLTIYFFAILNNLTNTSLYNGLWEYVTWVGVSVCLLGLLVTTRDEQEPVPALLVAGIVSLAMIILAISFFLPNGHDHFSALLFLFALSLMLVASIIIHGFLFFMSKRRTFLSGMVISCLVGFLFVWILLTHYDVIHPSGLSYSFLTLLMILIIVTSIFLEMRDTSPRIYDMAVISQEGDIFSDNALDKRDILKLNEAKEQSEHRRLLQVIEQERKVMAELQIKTAKQNEDMRKSKEAADEANRAKSAFLAIVSHEIRTPMTGILGMLRLLQETQLSKEQKEYASTIKDSGDAMLALLNDILDFEKIESGKMDLENISFDLKRLIKGVYTLMRGHADSKNIELVLEVDETIPAWVYGDPTRLRQVLLNLINNAIKFTNKGAVYLRIRNLTGESGDALPNLHQLYFAVQDSGIGISLEGQKKLFMPFAQADTSISRKYGGTGLGLAICKRLIEAMGGAISISSKENEGSTFFFTLTMRGGDAQAAMDDGSLSGETVSPLKNIQFRKPPKVLVVDDNGINQKVVIGFAEKLGATCQAASSGNDALTLVKNNLFDVILMDLQLPDMNGIEVTECIRGMTDNIKSSVPVIGLSGNTSPEDIQACYDGGMNDFAAKPITFEKIAELLKRVDDGEYRGMSSPPMLVPRFDTQETSMILNKSSSPDATGRDMYHDISLDDDEDSFAMAVKQFEQVEKVEEQTTASMSLNTSQPSPLFDYGLDADILGSLRDSLSAPQLKEIMVGFYEKADELVAAIGTSYESGDTMALYARAHELKGMAGNFGFSTVSQMCAAIEKAAKANELSSAKLEIESLGERYAVARNHLNQWLS